MVEAKFIREKVDISKKVKNLFAHINPFAELDEDVSYPTHLILIPERIVIGNFKLASGIPFIKGNYFTNEQVKARVMNYQDMLNGGYFSTIQQFPIDEQDLDHVLATVKNEAVTKEEYQKHGLAIFLFKHYKL